MHTFKTKDIHICIYMAVWEPAEIRIAKVRPESRNKALELSSVESSDSWLALPCTELYLRGSAKTFCLSVCSPGEGKECWRGVQTAVWSVRQKPTVIWTQYNLKALTTQGNRQKQQWPGCKSCLAQFSLKLFTEGVRLYLKCGPCRFACHFIKLWLLKHSKEIQTWNVYLSRSSCRNQCNLTKPCQHFLLWVTKLHRKWSFKNMYWLQQLYSNGQNSLSIQYDRTQSIHEKHFY